MGVDVAWQNLLQTDRPVITAPWTGGGFVWLGTRKWSLHGARPAEHCWGRFECNHRGATFLGEAEPDTGILSDSIKGYLVADRLVPDGTAAVSDLPALLRTSERVALVPPGLGRFARVCAGHASAIGPLIYSHQEFPLGPEDEVLHAYQDRKESVGHIAGVTPGLDAAFRLETEQRSSVERRRAELERQRLEEQQRLEREQRSRELARRMGDGASRRQMAAVDFVQAARAALAIGGAEYIDHIRSHQPHEMCVCFRFMHRRFECVCDERTLRIVDAGICLDDGLSRGDDRFTLESLPSVIREAINTGVLHVHRRIDDDYDDGERDW